jgi:opacity protein-like surface antigen
MKTVLMAAVAAATLAATAAAAQDAPQAGWYVRGDGGATFDSKLDGSNGPHSDIGWAAGAGVGRDFGDGWRLEGQALYLDNNGKHSQGDTQVIAGFVNGYYDFLKGSAWQPFVGAGVGVAQVKVQGDDAPIQGDHTGFAYQVQAGVAHPFTRRLIGEVAYRYIGVTDNDIGVGANRIHGDYATSVVTAGLRYAF